MVLSAALDLIGVTAMRNDPLFANIDGRNQTVVVMDTGLDAGHPFISGNFRLGGDFVGRTDPGTVPTVTGNHGTHVAGIVGSTNPEIGVATGVDLIVFNVSPNGQTIDGTALENAMQWVVANGAANNVVAVNLSLGGGNFRLPSNVVGYSLLDEIEQLESQGIAVVSAAGNNFKQPGDQLEFPNLSAPAIVSTIAVGAVWQDSEFSDVRFGSGATDVTTGADRVTSFSNRLRVADQVRDNIDTLFAPGAIIVSTVPRADTSITTDAPVRGLAGTSMAAPMVAGVVALVQDAATQFLGRRLDVNELTRILFETGVTINDGDDEDDNVLNTGADYRRVDAHAAVRAVRNLNVAPPPPPPPEDRDPNATIATAELVVVPPVINFTSVPGDLGNDGATAVGGADVDMYRLDPTVTGPYTLTTSSSLDLYLRVFDANGQQLSLDDDSGEGLNPALSVTLTAGDSYFFGVSGYPNFSYDPNLEGVGTVDSFSTGTYTLDISLDAQDPNGTRGAAVPLAFEGTASGLGSEATALGFLGADFGQPVGGADVDFFQLIIPAAGTLHISAATPETDGHPDTVLTVFRAARANESPPYDDRQVFAFDDDSGEGFDSLISDLAVEAGDILWIGVSAFENRNYDPDNINVPPRNNDARTGTYTLTATLESQDLNGTIASATQLLAGQLPIAHQQGRIGEDVNRNTQQASMAGALDVDFIRVSAPADGILQFSINSFDLDGVPPQNAANVQNPVDTVLTLFDSNGNMLFQIDDTFDDQGNFVSLDPSFTYAARAGETYYIAVTGYANFDFDPNVAGSGTPAFLNPSAATHDYLFSMSLQGQVTPPPDDGIGGGNDPGIILNVPIFGNIGADLGNRFRDQTAADGDNLRYAHVGADGLVDVRAQSLGAFDGNAMVRVFTEAGQQIQADYVSIGPIGGGAVRFNAVQGQVYYINLTGATSAFQDYDPIATDSLEGQNDPNIILSNGGYDVTARSIGTLDIDGDGTAGGFVDAILAARYVLGLRANITQGLSFAAGATRTTGQEIRDYLDASSRLILDGDGSGGVSGFNDAIVAARYILGLTQNVASGLTFEFGATRTTAADINAYLAPVTPRVGGQSASSARAPQVGSALVGAVGPGASATALAAPAVDAALDGAERGDGADGVWSDDDLTGVVSTSSRRHRAGAADAADLVLAGLEV